MNALMPRASVEELVGYRDEALRLYEEAYRKIEEARQAFDIAHDMARRAAPIGGLNDYNYNHVDEVREFFRTISLPHHDQFMAVARRITAINLWATVIERTQLEKLMDAEAKENLRKQMVYVPTKAIGHREIIDQTEMGKMLPEPTVENVVSTIEYFTAEFGNIFRRGIANVFSQLDRRFRTHDGFKIGSRIILRYVFDDWGNLRHGKIRDILIDVERIFCILDGKFDENFRSALEALKESRRGGGFEPRQSVAETEYFTIRGYKNGNAHMWFKRDDLVERVNKILAEWYGEVIGDARQEEVDPLKEKKTTPAKFYGFYPTPEETALRVIDRLPLYRRPGEPPLRILEPSAGTGNLARLVAKEQTAYSSQGPYTYRHIVDCVEIQPHLAEALRNEGIYGRVFQYDFLQLTPDVTGLYDRIIMNPPFDRERDIDHVTHALDFLKPGGTLVAIMSAGTEFRETKKSKAFRNLMEQMKASWYDLPPGSFSEVGTNCNTLFIVVTKR